MSVDYLPQPNNTYAENVSTAPAGTVLVGQPCQVWKISVKNDLGAASVLNFSDTSTAYSATYRIDKAVTAAGQVTVEMTYPHGLNCTRGLCVTSNAAGVDIFVSYD